MFARRAGCASRRSTSGRPSASVSFFSPPPPKRTRSLRAAGKAQRRLGEGSRKAQGRPREGSRGCTWLRLERQPPHPPFPSRGYTGDECSGCSAREVLSRDARGEHVYETRGCLERRCTRRLRGGSAASVLRHSSSSSRSAASCSVSSPSGAKPPPAAPPPATKAAPAAGQRAATSRPVRVLFEKGASRACGGAISGNLVNGGGGQSDGAERGSRATEQREREREGAGRRSRGSSEAPLLRPTPRAQRA